ncbi:MAG: hypothetical protein R3C11_11370 [Planctomycetaceae bacterium]
MTIEVTTIIGMVMAGNQLALYYFVFRYSSRNEHFSLKERLAPSFMIPS